MAVTFQRVDTDLSTVLLDLNGGGNGFTLTADPDFGTITSANSYVRDLGPETNIAAADHPLVDVRFSLIAQNTTTDTLRTLAGQLATQLQTPGTYKIQTAGMASALFFDAFQADIPGLLRGQEIALWKITQLLKDVDGLPVVLHRLPYFYAAAVSSSATVVNNDPSTGTNPRRFSVTATGNMPTRANIKIAPEAGSKVVQVRVARRSHGDQTSFNANWFQRANGGAITGASANVADATGTGGNVLNITSSSATVMLRRRRWAVNPSPASGLEGTFRVYGRLKCNGTGANTYRLQLRWAAGNVDPATFANDEVTLTFPGGTGQPFWGLFDLGSVTVDTGLGTTFGLALELWAVRDTGSDDLYADYVDTMPVTGGVNDQMATFAVRGFRDEFGLSRASFTGDQLKGGDAFVSPTLYNNGTLDNKTYKLEDTDQAAGTPPPTGLSIAAGRYTVQAHLTVNRPTGGQIQNSGRLVAYNMDTSAEIATVNVGFSGTARRREYDASLTFDLTGTALVMFFVVQTASLHVIRISRIWFSQQPALGSGQEMNVNGEYGLNAANPASYVTASGVYSQPLSQEGAFIDLMPGANNLVFDWGEQPPAFADQIDAREPIPATNLTRNCTVTVTYYPRFSH